MIRRLIILLLIVGCGIFEDFVDKFGEIQVVNIHKIIAVGF